MKLCGLNGLKFYFLEEDRYVGQRVELGKYEPYETEVMLRQVKAGDVVVDIGANIGYYTLLLAQKVGPKGKVYAFEPEKTNFEILQKNVEVNGLNNVILFEAAVGENEEVGEMIVSEENLGDHRIAAKSPPPLFEERGGKTQRIKIVRLDEVIKEKVDLMKIDTQGYEPMVIKGAKKLIEKYKPQVFMEYMPEAYAASGGDGKAMMEWLSPLYKNTYIIDDYLFAYYKGRLPIDNYCKNTKGYTDIWLSNSNSLNLRLGQLRDIRIKKLLRKLLGLKQTG